MTSLVPKRVGSKPGKHINQYMGNGKPSANCTQVLPREGTYPKTLSQQYFFNLKSTIHFGVKGRIAPGVIWKLLGSPWNCWWIRSGCFGNYPSTLTTMLVTIAAGAGCLLHHQKKRHHLVPYYTIVLPFCAIPHAMALGCVMPVCLAAWTGSYLSGFLWLEIWSSPTFHWLKMFHETTIWVNVSWHHSKRLQWLWLAIPMEWWIAGKGKKNYQQACIE